MCVFRLKHRNQESISVFLEFNYFVSFIFIDLVLDLLLTYTLIEIDNPQNNHIVKGELHLTQLHNYN